MNADEERPVCGAEEQVPKGIVDSYLAVCGRDLSQVVLRCGRIPRHPHQWHAGRLLDVGEIHWKSLPS